MFTHFWRNLFCIFTLYVDFFFKIKFIITRCAFNELTLFLIAPGTEYTTIVPVVKTPTSPGRTDLSPRSPIQNKCLITWGFSSTSFTGAELQANSTWTVTIERNTGAGGDFNTGCLFGIGLSPEPLNIKDLVGSTDGTCGVVCSNGGLYFMHSGQRESLAQLECLPISVTLSVNIEHERYTVLSYKLEAAAPKDSQSLPLEGRKVLDSANLKRIVYPVFTVSQRVKLLFPTYVWSIKQSMVLSRSYRTAQVAFNIHFLSLFVSTVWLYSGWIL